MAALTELEQFDAEVFRIETDTVWKGGEEGPANKQGKALANRTGWLKAQVEALVTGKQPLDGTLTAIAALATVADRMIYSTGADTFAITPLTAFIRTLLDDADAAAARTTLGAISQAQLDASIASLVASSPAALDTLNELAAALGNDANFATTVNNAIALRVAITDYQKAAAITSAAGGTADAITATFTPPIAALTNGMKLYVRAGYANATTTPTFTPNSGVIVAKSIVKGAGAALSASDIAGGGYWLELQYDGPLDKWVLLNPANGVVNTQVPAGTIIDFSGTTAPAGYLVCPTSMTNVSRTVYAALFAAIGTTWGAGDGATTFGIPFFPADYAAVQANSNVGTSTAGQLLAHTHGVTQYGQLAQVTSGGTGNIWDGTGSGATSSAGGAANLAAGKRVLKCVKF